MSRKNIIKVISTRFRFVNRYLQHITNVFSWVLLKEIFCHYIWSFYSCADLINNNNLFVNENSIASKEDNILLTHQVNEFQYIQAPKNYTGRLVKTLHILQKYFMIIFQHSYMCIISTWVWKLILNLPTLSMMMKITNTSWSIEVCPTLNYLNSTITNRNYYSFFYSKKQLKFDISEILYTDNPF